MSYLSLSFLAFLLCFVVIYYICKKEYRYLVLFFGSYFFYGIANYRALIALVIVTAISYFGGLVLSSKKTRLIYGTFFAAEILVLILYKYTDFLFSNISFLSHKIAGKDISLDLDIVLPVGLSFMVFQSCSYLSELYRGRITVEKNVIRYATFVAFFPTVLSGPIQKARNLLPQIASPKDFDYDQAKKGTLLFIWGVFEKILVANKLSQIYLAVLPNFKEHTSAEILLGAMSFSIYIYADFSAYSDMARGVSKLLGIDVGKNFNNPYLSQSTSEFWNRWHVSLNDWFKENVYIPLGGNRRGTLRKYCNVLIVFLISGLWHGEYWHFIAWGLINGAFVVMGQIIKTYKTTMYRRMNVNEKAESIVLIRRGIVFYLITLTWTFFSSTFRNALSICKRIVLFDYLSIFDPDLLTIAGTEVATFITVITVILFSKVQIARQDEASAYEKYRRQPFLVQCFLAATIICICIFAACETGANVNTQFIYFSF